MSDKIYTVQTSEQDYLSVGILEILSIPNYTITPYESISEANKALFADTTRVLSSIYDIHKNILIQQGANCSIELAWTTEPIEHQTYTAQIRLFFIIRSIAHSKAESEKHISQLVDAVSIMLEINRFSYDEIGYNELQSILQGVNFESRYSIIREVRTESLPVPAIPQCINFDCFDANYPAVETMINAMIKSPKTMVSLQLIPQSYSAEEIQHIQSVSQTLGMLSSGLRDPSFGAIPIIAAQKCYDMYSYYNDHAKKALFEFNIAVYGPAQTVNRVSFALQSALSGAGATSLTTCSLQDVSKDIIIKNYYANPWMLSNHMISKYPTSNQSITKRLSYIISAEEASVLFSLPIGSDSTNAGITVEYSSKSVKEYRFSLLDAQNISAGRLKTTTNTHYIGFAKDDLAKHMLVVGTPGSGKTTFSVGLLDRLWKKQEPKIPFLVIEPAKNEYRALVQSIPDLQIFTPGKNMISPFVFNPFLPPENVRLESYKSVLKTAFEAGVTMTSPLDKIFEETINNCYSEFGWLDTYTSSDKGKVFNISDFIQCFQRTVDDIGYTGEASNIAKAGVVRLKGLINLFDTYNSIPIKDILSKPTVIELAAIENQSDKALIIALLLLSIMSYINANYVGNSTLRNVILLEEAHVLLDAQSHEEQGAANPSAVAQGLIKRMLAEIRSYGVGLIIADQSPRKVGVDVVALTDIKLAFRLVENEDKRIIANSINMTEVQLSRLARLKPGESFFFFNKLDEPEEIITDNYRLEHEIDITLADSDIAKLSTYWQDKSELLKPYPECSYCRHCPQTCFYLRRLLAREIARRIFVKYFKANIDGKIPNQYFPGLKVLLSTIAQEKELTKKDQEYASKLYTKFFKGNSSKETLEYVFKHIVTISKEEANGENITPELLICIKMHLFRKLKYETQIKITDSQKVNSLSM